MKVLCDECGNFEQGKHIGDATICNHCLWLLETEERENERLKDGSV